MNHGLILNSDQAHLNRINWEKARKYFGIENDSNLVLHHVDKSLRHTDIDRYIQWNPDDLIVMTNEEHTKLHNAGKILSDETKKKLSDYASNRPQEINDKIAKTLTGRKLSDSTKDKLRNAVIGRHWYNNNIIEIRAYECPDGFSKGRLKKKGDNSNETME